MSKILTVFGATGNQGGSVVKAILAHPELSKTWKIRAITRDVSKPSAVALKEKGAEVVTADMSDRGSIFKAIKGSSAVFGVTNFWEKADADYETNQGKTLVDACKEAGVERFIWSSLPNVTEGTNGKISTVHHFDSKARVEEYARQVGVPSSFVMPAVFLSFMLANFKKDQTGTYVLTLPLDPEKTRMPMIDASNDVGLFAALALLRPEETLNQRLAGAAGLFSPNQMVEEFRAVTGKEAKYNHITYETFRSFLSASAADELVGNMQLIEDPGYYVGESSDFVSKTIDELVDAGLRKPTTWKEYVQNSFKEQ